MRDTSLNPQSAWRYAYRNATGRSGGTYTFQHPATGQWVTVQTRMLDPMLLLRSARTMSRLTPNAGIRYGELRQRVISPVLLP